MRDEIAEALAGAAGVSAPSDVTVHRIGGSVQVRWQTVPGPDLTYRVQRRKPDVGWHTVGRPGAGELEDGGAPPGQPLTYAVVAIQAGSMSAPDEGHCP